MPADARKRPLQICEMFSCGRRRDVAGRSWAGLWPCCGASGGGGESTKRPAPAPPPGRPLLRHDGREGGEGAAGRSRAAARQERSEAQRDCRPEAAAGRRPRTTSRPAGRPVHVWRPTRPTPSQRSGRRNRRQQLREHACGRKGSWPSYSRPGVVLNRRCERFGRRRWVRWR